MLAAIHNKHLHERLSLVQLLGSCDSVKAEQLQLFEGMSEAQRQERLTQLHDKRSALPLGAFACSLYHVLLSVLYTCIAIIFKVKICIIFVLKISMFYRQTKPKISLRFYKRPV